MAAGVMASAAAPARSSPARIAFAGLVALAVAMGIGRFAFTPLLPMMLHDGVIDLPAASWLASANYLGYLLGALLCTFQPWIWARVRWLPAVRHTTWIRAGLAATCVLTLGMVLPWPPVWPLLRFAAGLASAVGFVFTSGWCLAHLASLGRPTLGGMIYVGPGGGIVLSGLMASGMVALDWRAAAGWAVFGVLASALVLWVWPIFRSDSLTAAPVNAAATALPPAVAVPGHQVEKVLLAVAYGLAGFGYIITATFLPVIAREALPASGWLDLFWPMLGLGVMAGALLATRIPMALDRRYLLAACYLVQAAGIAVSAWSPTLAGFVLGSLLVGLPFTVITFFGMQEARRLAPAAAASFMGLITAMYGAGQIGGPLVVPWLIQHSSSRSAGFTLSLEAAAVVLVVGAALYLLMVWLYPLRPQPPQGSRSAT